MATDSSHASGPVRDDYMGKAYISPVVDFLLIAALVAMLAVTAGAIILP